MVFKSDPFTFFVHFPIMIFELITASFILLIGIVIFLRWRERRTIPTLYLALALFAIGTAVLIAFSGLFSWFLEWVVQSGQGVVISTILYSLSLPLAYCFVILYDIMLVLFTIHIFTGDKNEKKVIPVIVIGAVMAVLLLLPINYWGTNESVGDLPSIRTITLALFLLFNMIIYVILAFYALREAKQAEQQVNKRAFQCIGLGQFLNIMVFIFFLGDAIIILLDPTGIGYSIFVYMAWATALVAITLFYLGFILPEWFKKRISKE